MTQREQVEHLAMVLDTSKAFALITLKTVIKMITDELLKNGRVPVSSLGIFTTRQRSARETTIMQGPDKGKKVMVAPHKAVGFKPSKELKRAVNPGGGK